MTIPSATYRLQFRNGMTFDRAIALIPHLKSLSISHLYASPIFTATSGSTHGYDVTDANEIDPAIGGRAGFDRLSAALKQAEIGLILDIVPNHMAASVENGWWRDVLRHGSTSAYAGHFDIDWSRKLTLPILGKPLGQALADGELHVVKDEGGETSSLAYFDTHIPLSPQSAAQAGSTDAIAPLLAQQPWELLYWKEASENLSYRRFFEVTGLVGLCVEKPEVFEDSHQLILELVRSGAVQGLRIDHVDGLADPAGYLERLRQAVGPQVHVTVEKILGPGETIAPDWPVAGTTGYEFITALSHLFIDSKGMEQLQVAYQQIDPFAADYAKGLREAKSRMAERNFKGEVTRLVALAQSVAPGETDTDLRTALHELLVAFPVYRTYGYRLGLGEQDKAILAQAVSKARIWLTGERALGVIERLILGDFHGDAAAEFRTRFQQLSGPVMAKALEDTLFYRYNRLLAANEVGGEPDHVEATAALGIQAFHAAMRERLQTQPHGLNATSTHDTKRGEDARARLYALSEGAQDWCFAVERWRQMNSDTVVQLPEGPAPEANVEWMLYQSLAGIWPAEFDPSALAGLKDRFLAYTEKALREAKLRTDWAEPNEAYEQAVQAYAERLVSPENQQFIEDFDRVLQPFIAAGARNSLAQTLIKLTAPGVPDIYQGAEGVEDSLVDPDNRRTVDYAALALARGGNSLAATKQELIRKCLALRARRRALFENGDYRPLDVTGAGRDRVLAFARAHGDEQALTIVPRLTFGTAGSEGDDVPHISQDTALVLPDTMRGPWQDLLSGRSFRPGSVQVCDILNGQDVVLLISPSLAIEGAH